MSERLAKALDELLDAAAEHGRNSVINAMKTCAPQFAGIDGKLAIETMVNSAEKASERNDNQTH